MRFLLAAVTAASVLIGAGGASAAPIVFTQRVGIDTAQPVATVGTIAGLAGHEIHILKIGIGGDSDSMSGPNTFRLAGGGLDFTWAAGQFTPTPAPTYMLSPTPAVAGPTSSARGFTYQDLSLFAAEGAALTLTWTLRFDYDGRYTYGTDVQGNVYDDSAHPSSIRPWVLYEYVATNVPEPMTLALFGAALAGLGLVRRRAPLECSHGEGATI